MKDILASVFAQNLSTGSEEKRYCLFNNFGRRGDDRMIENMDMALQVRTFTI